MTLTQKTIRNAGIIYTTTILAKLLSIFSIIVLARLLTPSDFGVVGISAIVIGMISLMQDFGLNAALIQKKNDISETANIVFYCTILINFLLYVIAFFVAPFASEYFKEPAITSIIRVGGLSLIIDSLSSGNTGILTKRLLFKKIAFVTFVRNVIGVISSIILAFLGFSYWSLIYGNLISSILNTILLWVVSDWRPTLQFNFRVAREMFSYGKNIIVIIAMTFGVKNADNFVVGRILGSESLGVYGIAYKFGMFSATYISTTIGTVLFPVYSQLQDSKEAMKRAYLKTLRFVSYFAIPLSIGTIVLAHEFVIYILGAKWEAVTFPLQILTIAGLFASLGGPSWNIFLAAGKPSISSKIAIIEFVTIIILIYPFIKVYGLSGSAFVVSVSFIIGTIYSFQELCGILDISYYRIMHEMSSPLLSSCLMLLILVIFKQLTPSSLIMFIILIIIGALIYSISMYFFTKGEIMSDIRMIYKSFVNR